MLKFLQTDKQTDRWTGQKLYSPDLSIGGHKNTKFSSDFFNPNYSLCKTWDLRMTFIYPIHNFAFSCSKSYAINMINQTVIETKNLHILMSTFPIYHNHLYWKTAIIFVSFSALPAVLTSVSQLGYKSCMVYWGLQNAFNLINITFGIASILIT
jgi:hypothetical protein